MLFMYSEDEREALREEEKLYESDDASAVDPLSVSIQGLPARLSQCSKLQMHRCTENCLIRKWSVLQCTMKGFDPRKDKVKDLPDGLLRELMKCKKNFPRTVPAEFGETRAHVVLDYTKIVKYHPPRDDPMVNNYHPMIAHVWGANTDIQILHGQGMCGE